MNEMVASVNALSQEHDLTNCGAGWPIEKR